MPSVAGSNGDSGLGSNSFVCPCFLCLCLCCLLLRIVKACLLLTNSGLPFDYSSGNMPSADSCGHGLLRNSLVPPTGLRLHRSPGVSHISCNPSRWIYPPKLRMTIGFPGSWAGSPFRRALYPVSVRRNASLSPASFRFRLPADTLAFNYEIPVITAPSGLEVLSSHLLEVWHARHTKYFAALPLSRPKSPKMLSEMGAPRP